MKIFLTKIALKRLCPIMCPLMNSEFVRSGESLPTLLTLIWSLSSMSAIVPSEVFVQTRGISGKKIRNISEIQMETCFVSLPSL